MTSRLLNFPSHSIHLPLPNHQATRPSSLQRLLSHGWLALRLHYPEHDPNCRTPYILTFLHRNSQKMPSHVHRLRHRVGNHLGYRTVVYACVDICLGLEKVKKLRVTVVVKIPRTPTTEVQVEDGRDAGRSGDVFVCIIIWYRW